MSNKYNFYIDGKFVEYDSDNFEFIPNERIAATGGVFKKDYFDYIKNVPRHSNEDPEGCIRKWFNPIKVEYIDKKTGQLTKGTPPGIYSISYDPVGIDKDKKELTNKHSHNSIKVWMNPCIYNGYRPRLCAVYYGRPDELEKADRICYYFAITYNCLGTTNAKKINTIGYDISSETVKLDGLRMLKEMLYSPIGKFEDGRDMLVLHTIYDYQSILELKKWSNTGNFDRVSEMIVRGIEWAANDKFAKKQLEHRQRVQTEKENFWNRKRY